MPEPPLPIQSNATLIEISDKEEGNEDNNVEDSEKDIEDDDAGNEEEERATPFKF
jgi:hypothetical protein